MRHLQEKIKMMREKARAYPYASFDDALEELESPYKKYKPEDDSASYEEGRVL